MAKRTHLEHISISINISYIFYVQDIYVIKPRRSKIVSPGKYSVIKVQKLFLPLREGKKFGKSQSKNSSGVDEKLESLPTLSHSVSISSSGFDKSARCCSNFLDSEGWGLVNISSAIRRMAQGSREEEIRMIFKFFSPLFFSLTKSFQTKAKVRIRQWRCEFYGLKF